MYRLSAAVSPLVVSRINFHAIHELAIFARERVCTNETTDDKLNAGRKARPASESQEATAAGSGPDDTVVV